MPRIPRANTTPDRKETARRFRLMDRTGVRLLCAGLP